VTVTTTFRPFSHTPAGPSVFGPGVAATIADKTLLKKAQKVVVVTDAGVRTAGLLSAIVAPFANRVAFVEDGVVPDACCDHVDATAARARDAGCDAVLAVGGGSVIDTAKGVVAALARGAPIASLEGYATIRTKTLPLVCVPTTAGTGSEATQFAVLKDRAAGRKRIYVDASLVPALAVLDPTLVTGLPRAVTAATAVDALTHALEAIGSKLRNPIGTALATEACRLLLVEKALARSLERPDDIDARGACLIAAHLAGQAVSTAMLGACHALAHVTGARTGIPHGVANGLFVVDVLRANTPKAAAAYATLARSLGIAGGANDVDASGGALVEALVGVVDDFVFGTAGLPRRLRDAAPALVEGDLPALAQAALADPDLPTNPVALDEAALLSILQRRW
jgi:alcohol dehydrogenase class IV